MNTWRNCCVLVFIVLACLAFWGIAACIVMMIIRGG